MKQAEYLRELRENLAGRLPESALNDVLADYEGFFIAGRAEGRTDDDISSELGSPAMLARTLLEEGEVCRKRAIPQVVAASPWRRLLAWLVDTATAVLPGVLLALFLPAYFAATPLLFIWTAPSPLLGAALYMGQSAYFKMHTQSSVQAEGGGVISSYVEKVGEHSNMPGPVQRAGAVAALAFYVLYLPVCTVISGGRTLGKRLLRIRVRARDGNAAPRGALAARELVGRILLSIIPVVPLVSLIMLLVTGEHRALHDYLAGTVVTDA